MTQDRGQESEQPEIRGNKPLPAPSQRGSSRFKGPFAYTVAAGLFVVGVTFAFGRSGDQDSLQYNPVHPGTTPVPTLDSGRSAQPSLISTPSLDNWPQVVVDTSTAVPTGGDHQSVAAAVSTAISNIDGYRWSPNDDIVVDPSQCQINTLYATLQTNSALREEISGKNQNKVIKSIQQTTLGRLFGSKADLISKFMRPVFSTLLGPENDSGIVVQMAYQRNGVVSYRPGVRIGPFETDEAASRYNENEPALVVITADEKGNIEEDDLRQICCNKTKQGQIPSTSTSISTGIASPTGTNSPSPVPPHNEQPRSPNTATATKPATSAPSATPTISPSPTRGVAQPTGAVPTIAPATATSVEASPTSSTNLPPSPTRGVAQPTGSVPTIAPATPTRGSA